MRILRVLGCFLLTFCFVFTIFFGWKKIAYERPLYEQKKYKGIITLWHIETFEGGFGSRKQFLLDVASSFERENEGVLISVILHTVNSARSMLNEGVTPDMVSYGVGINFPNLKEIKTDKCFYGGKVGKECFAIPWCKGGYVMLRNAKVNKKRVNTISVSLNEHNLSTAVLALMDNSFNEIKINTPLEAYISFVSGEYEYLLGTQRDVVRVTNRGFFPEIIPIDCFNDLYQYISVCSNDDEKIFYIEKFIDLLLSEKVQKSLDKISMLSEFYVNNHQTSGLNKLENIKPKSTISAFSSEELILDIRNNAIKVLEGDKSALSKIKNVLILP